MATITSTPTSAVADPPRLFDQIRQAALAHFGRPEPGERYVQWSRRFILFHGTRHPRELGRLEIGRFLEHLAQSEKNNPLESLEAAREALGYLYDDAATPLGERLIQNRRNSWTGCRPSAPLFAANGNLLRRLPERFFAWRSSITQLMGARRSDVLDDSRSTATSASTQNQGFNALLFLYRDVLASIAAAWMRACAAAKRLPAVLSRGGAPASMRCMEAKEVPFDGRVFYGAGPAEECRWLRFTIWIWAGSKSSSGAAREARTAS